MLKSARAGIAHGEWIQRWNPSSGQYELGFPGLVEIPVMNELTTGCHCFSIGKRRGHFYLAVKLFLLSGFFSPPNSKPHIWDIQVFGTSSTRLQPAQDPDYASCFARAGRVCSPVMDSVSAQPRSLRARSSAGVNCAARRIAAAVPRQTAGIQPVLLLRAPPALPAPSAPPSCPGSHLPSCSPQHTKSFFSPS